MQSVQPNNASTWVRWLSPTLLLIFLLGLIAYPVQIPASETQASPIFQFPVFQVNPSSGLSNATRSKFTLEDNPSQFLSEFDLLSIGLLFQGKDQNLFGRENSCRMEQVAVHVFVPQHFNLPVIQQPVQDPVFVSTRQGEITQFKRAANFGAVGLLAHNNLSGKEFFKLKPNDPVWVLYSDGMIHRYRISSMHCYQKLLQGSTTSNFIDIENGETLTSTQVFNRFYRSKNQVIFQTCLENGGDSDWGLYFIVAEPV